MDLHPPIGVGCFWLSDIDSNSHRMWLWNIFMSASDFFERSNTLYALFGAYLLIIVA